MTLCSRFASVSLLFAVASCHDPAAPPLIAPPSSILIDGNLVTLGTSASTREVAADAPVTLRIRLTNEGAGNVTLHFTSTCQILPYIRDAGGTFVIPEGGNGHYGCGAMMTELSLAPGQSEVREYVWTGGTSLVSGRPVPRLPRGRYYFTAGVGRDLQSEPIELILK